MKYRSKIGVLWLGALILMGFATWLVFQKIAFDLTDWEFWLVILVFVPCDLLFIDVTIDNYTQFEEEYLVVKCGIFTCIKIPYHSIVNFKETRNPISSVGLSTDRLSILFKAQNGGNGNDEVLISPIKKQEFIQILEAKTGLNLTIK